MPNQAYVDLHKRIIVALGMLKDFSDDTRKIEPYVATIESRKSLEWVDERNRTITIDQLAALLGECQLDYYKQLDPTGWRVFWTSTDSANAFKRKDERLPQYSLSDALTRAQRLLSVVDELVKKEIGEEELDEEKPEEKKDVAETTAPTASVPTAGVAIPSAGAEQPETEGGDEEKTEEEKEEEKRKQPPQEDITLRTLANAATISKEYRREAARIREATYRAIAAAYGITNERDFQKFRKSFTGNKDQITPFILFELQKLSPEDLKRTDLRMRIYRDVLIRAEAQGSFQQQLQQALIDTLPSQGFESANQKRESLIKQFEGKVTAEKIQELIANSEQNILAKAAQGDVRAVAAARNVTESQRVLEQIAQSNTDARSGKAINDFETLFEDLLKKSGFTTETEIATIFRKLQTIAGGKIAIELLTDAQFDETFGEMFKKGDRRFTELTRLLSTQDQELRFRDLFLSYVVKKRQYYYELTGIRSTLYVNPRAQFSSKVLNEYEKAIFTYGDKQKHGDYAVILGLYKPQDELAKKRTEGSEDQRDLYNRAYAFHDDVVGNLRVFANRPKKQQRLALAYYGLVGKTYVDLVYEEQHQEELGTYITQYVINGFEDPQFLYDISDHGFFMDDSGNPMSMEGYGEQQPGALRSFLQDSKEHIDRKVGRAGIFLAASLLPGVGTAAAAEFFQTIDKLDAIPIVGPWLKEEFEKQLGEVGRLIELALLAILAIFAFVGMIGLILGYLFGQLLAKVLIPALMKMIYGIQNFVASVVSKQTLTSVLNGVRAAAGGVLSFAGGTLGALNAGVSTFLAYLGTGAGIAAATTTVVGFTLINSFFDLSFLTYKEAGRNVSITPTPIIRRDQPPDVGCFTFVDDEASITSLGPTLTKRAGGTPITPRQFTQTEMNYVAGTGGKVFISDMYYQLLCGVKRGDPIPDNKKVKLVAATGGRGGWTPYPDMIVLYNIGVSTQGITDYTLIHESGHVIDLRNGMSQTFSHNRDDDLCFPTYPDKGCNGGRIIPESFAEAIAVYVVYPYYDFSNGTGGAIGIFDYPGLRPKEYDWVQKNIFGSAL